MDINILGISAYFHDSAAALIRNGELLCAAQEERFTRKKNDASFPLNAVKYCLDEAGLTLRDIDYIAYYDKPYAKFERIFKTLLANVPRNFKSYVQMVPQWGKEKLFMRETIEKNIGLVLGDKYCPPILFASHHESHAAAAFFPSPYEKAAVLCVDGVGEWASTSVWVGHGNQLTPKWEIHFPHSLGLLYSAFTYYCGFKVNSGEYKLMGLAPYGTPRYADLIRKHLIDIRDDGTFKLNIKYFDFPVRPRMVNNKFCRLFGGKAREVNADVTQREMDIARSIQVVIEEVLLKLANTLYEELGCDSLCLAGGVALNCVANGKILRDSPFKRVWVQPAPGDAGSAVGAAYLVWHEYLRNTREVNEKDSMKGAFLGPEYDKKMIKASLDSLGANYEYLDTDKAVLTRTARYIANGSVVGWFQGRMEFGPRALGSRSILGDPRNKEMQKTLNLKIKKRESFRPFAPAVLEEEASSYFSCERLSPYMQFVANITDEVKLGVGDAERVVSGLEQLKVNRSVIPAVTHVDYSARFQTVNAEINPKFHQLICEFKQITGCPVLINTSFNVRGEPIVCNPEDAFRCFINTDMDYLVMGNFILDKKLHQDHTEGGEYETQFELD